MHGEDGYDDFQERMADYFKSQHRHPPTDAVITASTVYLTLVDAWLDYLMHCHPLYVAGLLQPIFSDICFSVYFGPTANFSCSRSGAGMDVVKMI